MLLGSKLVKSILISGKLVKSILIINMGGRGVNKYSFCKGKSYFIIPLKCCESVNSKSHSAHKVSFDLKQRFWQDPSPKAFKYIKSMWNRT